MRSCCAVSTAARRTFSAIVAAALEVRHKREARKRQEAEWARLAKLEALAKRQEQVWAQVPELLARRTASGYDQAVAQLADLHDLAVQPRAVRRGLARC
jgi:hypothetical protein